MTLQPAEFVPPIPFNRPFMTGKELWYIAQAHTNGHMAGDGAFTKRCEAWLDRTIGCSRSLLTHSCTAALEMAAILTGIQPGDEVIMPSFTFVSTANAFVLRGGTPVFVDIRPDTLNIDESKIEQAITSRTKAIVAVHYAGVACEMDEIMAIAERHGLYVIEDAAQSLMSTYKGTPLGRIGHLGTVSFHETKNISAGEAGALLVNDPALVDRAEVLREKGTNRSQFFRGQVDKYTWVDVGSSYLPGEIIAAFLWAQMEEGESITRRRLSLWDTYHEAFSGLELEGLVRRPVIPPGLTHNAHMYYLILESLERRTEFIELMRDRSFHCVFHYVPLHSSPAGQRFARTDGDLIHTSTLSDRLVRLPMWIGLEDYQREVISAASQIIEGSREA